MVVKVVEVPSVPYPQPSINKTESPATSEKVCKSVSFEFYSFNFNVLEVVVSEFQTPL